MDNVTHDVYEKYHDELIHDIKSDPFYKYYYNLLESGTMYSKFYNRKLLKEVDEEWVKAVENALTHIQYVVDHPRTFIEEDRQIVNVAVAKKFTVESIKHLAQHSEMVDRVKEDGSIEPNKVLNVFKEESLNTYENRFINTLLKELRSFINKRADVIFEQSKDEDGVLLEIDSNIDNYSEVITYKLEMRIREKQTDMVNDEENLNIFNRVSVVHRQVNDLASSGFTQAMADYPLVKHPVVKTNAIAKNQHYKACYDLWNFIHSYQRVGYKVELIEQDPVINRKFEEDIYHSLLLDYVILREHMTNKDILNIYRGLRKNEVSVSSIRQFMEEVVNEYDMPEAELKQLILKEFARAQREKNRVLAKAQEIMSRKQGEVLREEESGSESSWESFQSAVSGNTNAQKKEDNKNRANTKLSKREKDRLKKERAAKRAEEKKRQELELEEKRKQRALEEEAERKRQEEQKQETVQNKEGTQKNQTESADNKNIKERTSFFHKLFGKKR